MSHESAFFAAFAVIKIVAYGAMGVVVFGILATCVCDLFECRKWRQARRARHTFSPEFDARRGLV